MVMTIFPLQCLLSLSAPAISKTLNLIVKKCFSEGVYPNAWKFANVQPIHKKRVGRLNLIIVINPSFLYAGKFLEKIAFELFHE